MWKFSESCIKTVMAASRRSENLESNNSNIVCTHFLSNIMRLLFVNNLLSVFRMARGSNVKKEAKVGEALKVP